MKDVINANFVIGVNKSVSGTLELGSNKFKCWSTDFFHVQPHSNIYGTTHKGQPISLLNCLSFKETQYSGGNTRNCSGDLFSHTMLLGDKHIKPDEDLFDSISLVVKNPLKLFQDVKSFGYIQFPKEGLIEALNEEEFTPHFDIDKRPSIAYFNGDFEVFSQNTKLGKITASHCYSSGILGNVEGVHFKNRILITIDFNNPIKIGEAFERANLVTLFLRFISGHGLFFSDIELKMSGEEHFNYKVHHDYHNWGEEVDETYHSDPLINVCNDSFGTILKNWFDREDRKNVRHCFYNTFFSNTYSSDRLISAANMFDIFPSSPENSKKELNEEAVAQIESLKLQIKSDFKTFPDLKSSLLQSVSFLSRKSLKDRVLERFKIIEPKLIENTLSSVNFEFIIKYGIKCRNYFVHGSIDKALSPDQCFEFQSLFINTFEYIYAYSELIECGWNPSDDALMTNYHRIRSYEREIEFGAKQLTEIVTGNTK
ncbi:MULTISPECIES: HEPN domain-containing protein [unclassified Pseudoalteromonas]|uniref:ApeA N-terminal domain 1-containing protein n=1 Tax=unclassified Pseudoalteromonas TaxID=194690 RepID=UPI0025B5C6B9|nr:MULTISPECIES: HEPN domain-containing protein [unclassified Pseudoalteromonas]MDN3394257.1 hypothetical protein [Pseudoalteromonas sp. APC 3215]MDN3471713.1 hypothetical protein [Pseudoalteromonas sp. APC 4026]